MFLKWKKAIKKYFVGLKSQIIVYDKTKVLGFLIVAQAKTL